MDTEFSPPPVTDRDILTLVPSGYADFLQQKNGFVAFRGGLHVRGACIEPQWHSLRTVWQGPLALHSLYGNVTESDIPFAEDCVGDQFLIRSGEVLRLRAETGDTEKLGLGWREFLEACFANPIEFLALQPLLAFERNGERLGPGQLLGVYPPFFAENETREYSFRAIPTLELIGYLGELSKTVSTVPDGGRIEIIVKPRSA
jgi:hypothetical protein